MWHVLRSYPQFIFFTLIVSFYGGLGQTFILSLYNESLATHFNLSTKDLSWHYSLATFMAGCLIALIGAWLDRQTPKFAYSAIATALGLAFILMSLLPSAAILFLGFFLIRLFGQSGLPLSNSLFIAKKFGQHRGKVLGFTFLGRAFCEGVVPMSVMFVVTHYGWQQSFQLTGGLLFILAMVALIVFRTGNHYEPLYPELRNSETTELDYSLNYKSWIFAVILLGNCILPFVLTGFYFQQSLFRGIYHISSTSWAQAFLYYSVCQILFSIIAGYFSDWFSAKKVLFNIMLFATCAFTYFCFPQGELSIDLVFILIGMSVGWSLSCKSSFMAEIFSQKTLGKIKGIDTMVMVMATSLAPTIFSYIYQWQGHLGLKMILIIPTLIGLLIYLVLTLIPKHYLLQLLARPDHH